MQLIVTWAVLLDPKKWTPQRAVAELYVCFFEKFLVLKLPSPTFSTESVSEGCIEMGPNSAVFEVQLFRQGKGMELREVVSSREHWTTKKCRNCSDLTKIIFPRKTVAVCQYVTLVPKNTFLKLALTGAIRPLFPMKIVHGRRVLKYQTIAQLGLHLRKNMGLIFLNLCYEIPFVIWVKNK